MHRGAQLSDHPILAYVFWHWSRKTVSSDDYVRRLCAFHAALAAAPPAGFRESFSLALTGAPWTTGTDDVYEDWYLVRDFEALGTLNDAAVAAGRAGPHDAAAALAGGGAGGVYRLRQGVVAQQAAVAHWFSKPDGMPYSDLFAQLVPVVEQSGGALWMRQLVLGPAPEFCLHTRTAVSLAAELSPQVMSLRTVWPSS